MNRNIRTIRVILIALLGLAVATGGLWMNGTTMAGPTAPEGATTSIPYQGRLNGDSGQPVAGGSYDFTFEIYDAQSGGAPLWAETQTGVTVRDGYFSVLLGSLNPLGAEAASGEHYLAVSVQGPGDNGSTALDPRQSLDSFLLPQQTGCGVGVSADHDHWGETWSGSSTGLILSSSDSVGVRGETSSTSDWTAGVIGKNTGASGINYGVQGWSDSSSGRGVYGYNSSTSGTTYGVYGWSNSSSGRGVYGYASATSGVTLGVYGKTDSSSDGARGVLGWATATTGVTEGVRGQTASSSDGARGVWGYASATSGETYGVHGSTNSTAGRGVYGYNSSITGTTYGVYGKSNSSLGIGVYGEGDQYGVKGYSADDTGVGVYGLADYNPVEFYEVVYGVFGETTADSGTNVGVYGRSYAGGGMGVKGFAIATSGNRVGVEGGVSGIGYGLSTDDNLYVGGSCTGCTMVFIAHNASRETLRVGDVVAVSGVGPVLQGHTTPVLEVRQATAGDVSAMGVVYMRGEFYAAIGDLPEEDGDSVQPVEGDVAPDDYLLVVTSGLAQVRVVPALTSLTPGQMLTASNVAGLATLTRPDAKPDFVFGRAVEAQPDENGLLWAMISVP